MNTGGDAIVHLDDSLNCGFESRLVVQSVDVAPQADIRFDWSELSVDMLSEELDPLTGVDVLGVLLFALSEDELMRRMNDDSGTVQKV